MNADIENAFIAHIGHKNTISAMTDALGTITTESDLQALEDSYRVASSIADDTYKSAYKDLGHLVRDKRQELFGGFVV